MPSRLQTFRIGGVPRGPFHNDYWEAGYRPYAYRGMYFCVINTKHPTASGAADLQSVMKSTDQGETWTKVTDIESYPDGGLQRLSYNTAAMGKYLYIVHAEKLTGPICVERFNMATSALDGHYGMNGLPSPPFYHAAKRFVVRSDGSVILFGSDSGVSSSFAVCPSGGLWGTPVSTGLIGTETACVAHEDRLHIFRPVIGSGIDHRSFDSGNAPESIVSTGVTVFGPSIIWAQPVPVNVLGARNVLLPFVSPTASPWGLSKANPVTWNQSTMPSSSAFQYGVWCCTMGDYVAGFGLNSTFTSFLSFQFLNDGSYTGTTLLIRDPETPDPVSFADGFFVANNLEGRIGHVLTGSDNYHYFAREGCTSEPASIPNYAY